MARLMDLKFKILYKKGKENVAADALSRVANVMALQGVSEVQPLWVQEILNSYTTNSKAQQLLIQLAVHSPKEDGFSLEQGLIRYNGRIWLGENSAVQTKLIAVFHASAIGGHSGIKVTYHRLKQLFCWKGMKLDVDNFVKQCLVYQRAKHGQKHPAGLLQPLPIPDEAWKQLSMDFIEGLPLSEKCNVIVVVVDRLTKYAHFFAVKHPYTAQSIAQLFLDNVVKLHGMPKSIVSNRDPIFLSKFWKELFTLYEVKLTLRTAYHPQTNGQTERVNQCLEMYLRCAIHENPKQWKKWLPLAELWYNSSYHTSMGCSPFKALYGYEPNLALVPTVTTDTQPTIVEAIKHRELHLQALKQHLARAQNKMKLQADRKRTELSFQVGDKVLLKLQPYVQTSVANILYPKLAYKYYGPYEVVQKIGAVAYKLQLPPNSLIHPVFHISQLKPYTPDYRPVFEELPTVTDLTATTVDPEHILDRRLVKKGNVAIPQVKIKWTHLPEAAATWEDYNIIKTRFPSSAAWGQAGSSVGGYVTNAPQE
jgi:hypothetical protein